MTREYFADSLRGRTVGSMHRGEPIYGVVTAVNRRVVTISMRNENGKMVLLTRNIGLKWRLLSREEADDLTIGFARRNRDSAGGAIVLVLTITHASFGPPTIIETKLQLLDFVDDTTVYHTI